MTGDRGQPSRARRPCFRWTRSYQRLARRRPADAIIVVDDVALELREASPPVSIPNGKRTSERRSDGFGALLRIVAYPKAGRPRCWPDPSAIRSFCAEIVEDRGSTSI